MKLRKIIAVAAIALAATTAQAKYDANIPLAGGTAGPHDIMFVTLGTLLPGVDYDVYCKITSNHDSGSSTGYIKLYSHADTTTKFSMNDRPVASNLQTTIDAMDSNIMRAYKITKDAGYIAVGNLDDTDTITVSDCNAWPTTTDELKRKS